MAEHTFRRMEKKIIIEKAVISSLQEKLSHFMVPDIYNTNGKPYMICNLYFDDAWNQVIRTSVERPIYKEKLRLRSYGVPQDGSTVFLELKKKYRGVGTKRRVSMTYAEAMEYLATGKHPADLLLFINEQILREIDYYRFHHPVKPCTYVSYFRNAYSGIVDPTFRVTFDSDVLTRRYDLDLQKGRYGDPIFSPGKMLLEVKFTNAVPLWFARIMSEFGLSFHSFSKYGTAYRQNAYNQALAGADLNDTQKKQQFYFPKEI
ncbi:vTC domain protein [Clostridium sp. CAG:448]|nr:vTC domain protein [Clostridium sp. CAG:448]